MQNSIAHNQHGCHPNLDLTCVRLLRQWRKKFKRFFKKEECPRAQEESTKQTRFDGGVKVRIIIIDRAKPNHTTSGSDYQSRRPGRRTSCRTELPFLTMQRGSSCC
jgi:hypothetical protein